jgi:GxxExxY protein
VGKHADGLTEQIIGCAFDVHNSLGYGFLEKVYENALLVELRRAGLGAAQQVPIPVHYREHKVGDFYADLLVEGSVIVEIKAVRNLVDVHEVQLVNYLKATGIPVGLLLNFGRKVEMRRKAFRG